MIDFRFIKGLILLIINSCENTVYRAILHIRIHLYNKSIINFISSFNTYHFNSSTLILIENIKSNTIKRHIDNTFYPLSQKTILRICHFTLKD